MRSNDKDELPKVKIEQVSVDMLDMTLLEFEENVITISELIGLFQVQSNETRHNASKKLYARVGVKL